jgi:hypothetical protein
MDNKQKLFVAMELIAIFGSLAINLRQYKLNSDMIKVLKEKDSIIKAFHELQLITYARMTDEQKKSLLDAIKNELKFRDITGMSE